MSFQPTEFMWNPWGDDCVRVEPFINEKEVKFWPDFRLNQYAHSKGLHKVACYFVEEPNGYKSRLITQAGQPIYEHQNLEAVCCYMDIMALADTYEQPTESKDNENTD